MALMTAGGCVTALAAFLETVAGIGAGAGRVHRYRRIMPNEAGIRRLMVGTNPASTGLVNGWMIAPAAAGTTATTRTPGYRGIGVKGGGQALTVMQWQVEGYFGLDDGAASEETFRDLAYGVVTELNQYGTLAVPGVVEQLPADMEQFGFVMLAGAMLLHYCRVGVAFRGRTV